MSYISKSVQEVIIPEDKKNNCTCKKCKSNFVFKPDETRWIEQGMYSEKVVKCPDCGCVNVVKYVDGFNQNPNWNSRYFK